MDVMCCIFMGLICPATVYRVIAHIALDLYASTSTYTNIHTYTFRTTMMWLRRLRLTLRLLCLSIQLLLRPLSSLHGMWLGKMLVCFVCHAFLQHRLVLRHCSFSLPTCSPVLSTTFASTSTCTATGLTAMT